MGVTLAHAGAIVIKDGACFLTGFASGLACDLTTLDVAVYHKTIAPSGNTSLVCHFDIPDICLPDEALESKGFNCTVCIPDVGCFRTTASISAATPSGNAVMSCKIKNYE